MGNFSYSLGPTSRFIQSDSFKGGVLNLDKPISTSSLEIIQKIKNSIGIDNIFCRFYIDKFISGCVILFFEKFYSDLSFNMEHTNEIVCVIKSRNYKKLETKQLPKYIKNFIYYSSSSPGKRVMKFIDVKKLLIDELSFEKNKFLCYFLSEKPVLPDDLKTIINVISRSKFSAHEIRQLKIGIFNEIDNQVLFQDILDISWNLKFWKNFFKFKNLLLPNQFVLRFFKKIIVKNSVINSLCYGSNLMIDGIFAIEKIIEKGEIVVVVSLNKEIIALGEIKFNSNIISKNLSGAAVSINKIIMEKNYYPKNWNLGINASLKKILGSIRTE